MGDELRILDKFIVKHTRCPKLMEQDSSGDEIRKFFHSLRYEDQVMHSY